MSLGLRNSSWRQSNSGDFLEFLCGIVKPTENSRSRQCDTKLTSCGIGICLISVLGMIITWCKLSRCVISQGFCFFFVFFLSVRCLASESQTYSWSIASRVQYIQPLREKLYLDVLQSIQVSHISKNSEYRRIETFVMCEDTILQTVAYFFAYVAYTVAQYYNTVLLIWWDIFTAESFEEISSEMLQSAFQSGMEDSTWFELPRDSPLLVRKHENLSQNFPSRMQSSILLFLTTSGLNLHLLLDEFSLRARGSPICITRSSKVTQIPPGASGIRLHEPLLSANCTVVLMCEILYPPFRNGWFFHHRSIPFQISVLSLELQSRSITSRMH